MQLTLYQPLDSISTTRKMFSLEDFYRGYQLNHFDYKQMVNEYLLNLPTDDMQKFIKDVKGSSQEEFRRTVPATKAVLKQGQRDRNFSKIVDGLVC